MTRKLMTLAAGLVALAANAELMLTPWGAKVTDANAWRGRSGSRPVPSCPLASIPITFGNKIKGPKGRNRSVHPSVEGEQNIFIHRFPQISTDFI